MLVVYGPKQKCKECIDKKIAPSISRWSGKPIVFEGNNYMMAFWQSHPEKEVVVRPDGWIIGNIYWDDLPPNYSRDSKDLLDVCHSLWRQEGVDFLKRLNGSFSLCLHDLASGKSLITTDRFSTYLLWRAEVSEGVIAVSPSYHILTPLVGKEIDIAALYSAMAPRRVIGNHSLLKNIQAFRESTAMCFDDSSGIKDIQWYTYRFEPDYKLSGRSWGQEYNRSLAKTVEDKLRDSKSPGCLMSGGIDSRLILTFCPPNTQCFTLADFNNIEMKFARTIAKICGLKHIPIIRDRDWYPNMLEAANKLSLGLWRWHNAHFLKLENYPGDWQEIDCVLTGCGFDTFFKAYEGRFEELWEGEPNMKNFDEAMSFMMHYGQLPCKFEDQLTKVMRPDAYKESRHEYHEVLRAELERVVPLATTPLEAWELIQFRAVYRMDAHTNLTSIRPFKASHNVTFDNRIYDIYFRVPSEIKRKASVIRWALWERNKKLGILPNSNSRIPAFLPKTCHEMAIKGQNAISRIRNRIYRRIGYRGYKSHGSWPRIDRLWACHPKMIATMDNLVDNPSPIIEQFFDMDAVKTIWTEHKNGTGNYIEVLDIIAGLSLAELV